MTKVYKPTRAFADFDPIVYRAGYAAQKTNYIFKDKTGKQISPKISSAREATVWRKNFEEFDEDTSGWVREPVINYLSEKQAIRLFDQIDTEYRKLAGNTITDFRGYLTSTDGKHKSMKGIEHEYQGNRADSVKPKHYPLLREYAEYKDFIKVCPEGFEADEILIANSERYGEAGVSLSIDKDMCTAENAWVIHVQKNGTGIPVWNTSLGHLSLARNGKHTKGVGGGFKFLAFQAIQGDPSDGFYGAKGVGTVTAVELIQDLETKSSIVEACVSLYEGIYGETYTYTSWDGQKVSKTPIELLQQHFEMPYMHRSNKDKGFDIYKYL